MIVWPPPIDIGLPGGAARFTASGFIGDNPAFPLRPGVDVDYMKLNLRAGETVVIQAGSSGSRHCSRHCGCSTRRATNWHPRRHPGLLLPVAVAADHVQRVDERHVLSGRQQCQQPRLRIQLTTAVPKSGCRFPPREAPWAA
jgi:hypothetical protein